MYRMLSRLVIVWLLTFSVVDARAFSLLGNYESWMTTGIGYRGSVQGDDLGGPMVLGNEYRWETPTIVYAYDQSFLNYFGTAGIKAIDAAFKILNDLPPASKTKADLSDIPLDTLRQNPTADSLGLLDLKSTALHYLMEELGLTDPERFVWTLRNRYLTGTSPRVFTNYLVFGRSFDPVSLVPSPYINGTLYTYSIQEPINNAGDAATIPVVSPADGSFFARLTLAGRSATFSSGQYFIGLTRDDIGGLRYLLSPRNFNVETLPPNTTVTGSGVVIAGGGPSSQVWLPVGAVGGTGTGAGVGGRLNPVNTALRPGRDKLRFVRANFDSLLGQAFQSVTNDYSDPYVVNSKLVSQRVRRVINRTDIIFTAQDLGFNNGTATPAFINRTDGKVSNGAINGTINSVGPGVIRGQILINFTTVLPLRYHQRGPGDPPPTGFDFLSLAFGAWGSFDGSDTPPIVFPDGLSISDLENLVLQGK